MKLFEHQHSSLDLLMRNQYQVHVWRSDVFSAPAPLTCFLLELDSSFLLCLTASGTKSMGVPSLLPSLFVGGRVSVLPLGQHLLLHLKASWLQQQEVINVRIYVIRRLIYRWWDKRRYERLTRKSPNILIDKTAQSLELVHCNLYRWFHNCFGMITLK